MADGDAVQPVWVVPQCHEVTDLIGVAGYTLEDVTCPTSTRLACGGMVTALGWVRDLLFGPITGRDEVPVTLAAARVETATAGALLDHLPQHLVRELCASLGVRYWPALDLERDYVLGAWVTLRWLTGVEETPPLPVPLRHPNGSLVTAAQVYDALLAGDPNPDYPLRRAELRRQAAEVAEQSYLTAKAIRRHVDNRRTRA